MKTITHLGSEKIAFNHHKNVCVHPNVLIV